MYGIILSNICCSFVCVSIEQLPVTIDVGPACTGGNCGEEEETSVTTIVENEEVILRTCNIQWNLSKPNPEVLHKPNSKSTLNVGNLF